MTYFDRTPLFILVSLLAACGPKDPADTESGSEGEATSTTTGPTTDAPTTTAPTTTTTTTTTEGTTTAGETTDEPPEAVPCEHVAGPADGAVDWYLRCGGPQNEFLNGVGTDADGNIYLGIDLRVLDVSAPLRIGEFEVTPGELSDILLIKLSSTGEPLWVRQFGGPLDQTITHLVACGDGLAIMGFAEPGTLDLGGGSLDGAFVAGFDLDGNHRWSRSLGGASLVTATCDAGGTLAVSGLFEGAVDFGGGPVEPPPSTAAFVAKYDAAGGFQWVQPFISTGDGSARVMSLAFTPAGELVLAGSFTGTVELGGGPLTTDFWDDMLVAKFGADGGHLWSQQLGGDGLQYAMAIAVDASGELALGGMFFDQLEIGADSYTNVFPDQIPEIDGTLYDAVLARLDPAGAVLSSQHLGAMLDDSIDDLSFDATDSLLVAGVADSQVALRAFSGEEQTWAWTTDQLPEYTRSARSGEDAVVLGSSPMAGEVDLGAGPTTDHGGWDFVVARIRR
ncbi:hypothetical protein SAMN02745121_08416 [Nannocystis exedens]|uniref:Uncharacterized protein n=1 Tax=Nannocystis exedens TaxID=54 RepID=A0A1I2I6T1_9BACT|nr:hypothetical protein [Nannocystis exedens]PCC74928.1 hypothetical protein NAEX_08028 [Nannocystis exedens]SFF36787.1 hypothetical protein SAMN02745121_08416 [Nannocystis exedens]